MGTMTQRCFILVFTEKRFLVFLPECHHRKEKVNIKSFLDIHISEEAQNLPQAIAIDLQNA